MQINGFQVRPGFFRDFGATIIPGGVNFTIQSHGAVSCELLLFHREAEEPFAVLKFPDNYRIGFVYSMIVFGLDIEEFEYAYRLDGPFDEKKGTPVRPHKNSSGSLCPRRYRAEPLGPRKQRFPRIPRPGPARSDF